MPFVALLATLTLGTRDAEDISDLCIHLLKIVVHNDECNMTSFKYLVED